MFKSTKYQTLIGKPGEHDETINKMLAEGWHLHGKPTAIADGDLCQVMVFKVEIPDPTAVSKALNVPAAPPKTTQATVKPRSPVNPLPSHVRVEYGDPRKGAIIDHNIALARAKAIERDGRAFDQEINMKPVPPLVSLANHEPRISTITRGGATVPGVLGKRGQTTGPVNQRLARNPNKAPAETGDEAAA